MAKALLRRQAVFLRGQITTCDCLQCTRFDEKPMTAFFNRIVVVMAGAGLLAVDAHAQSSYYTDTGSPVNPTWKTILPTLNVGTGDPGPVYGSLIDANNTLTKTGLYGNQPISVGPCGE